MKSENELYIESLELWIKEQQLLIQSNINENAWALERMRIDQQLSILRNEQNKGLLERIKSAEDEIKIIRR